MPARPATLLVILLLSLGSWVPAGGAAEVRGPEGCRVERVVDGDTFYCAGGPKVRLIGIDAPERDQGAPGSRSAAALRVRLPVGRGVRLERDVTLHDRYGRQLAYVWAGDTLVNEWMVRGGWAVVYTVPPNVKYVERLTAAQRAARESGAGLWATGGFGCLPSDHRRGRC